MSLHVLEKYIIYPELMISEQSPNGVTKELK